MKTTHTRCCILLMTAIAGQAIGGQLDPPAGPIEPTMKPLDAIEPRICINELPGSPTAVHVITEPGNYYLTGNVIGEPGKNGIEIAIEGLPPGEPVFTRPLLGIDGNGFGLIGGPGTLDGVSKTDKEPLEDFSLKFCKIRVTSWGGDGLHLEDMGSVTIDNAVFESNGGDGVEIVSDGSVTLSNLNVSGCGGDGVQAYGDRFIVDKAYVDSCIGDGAELRVKGKDENSSCWIRVSQFHNNGGDGLGVHIDPSGDGSVGEYDVRVRSVNAAGNVNTGVRVSNTGDHSVDAHLDGLVCNDNAVGVSVVDASATITDSRADSNTSNGIQLDDTTPGPFNPTEWQVIGTTCSNNSTNGASLKKGDHVRLIGFGSFSNGGSGVLIEDSEAIVDVRELSANNNGGYGFAFIETLDNPNGTITMTDSVTNGNVLDGVFLEFTTGGTIRRCEASDNGGIGFAATATGHVVIENVASGNALGGFDFITPGNSLGPVIGEAGIATNTNPAANYVR